MMLYFHIPFCSSHCSYCAFYSTTSTEAIGSYYTTLCSEIQYTPLLHGNIEKPISSIFFGGGTPSLLPAQYIHNILTLLRTQYDFSESIEITLEANPESISEGKAFLWHEAGVNRISIGCQSLLPEALVLLQRIHSVEHVYHALEICKSAGFQNISLDMIWGRPNHTLQQWTDELQFLFPLNVQHLSCYALTIEENTLLAKQHTLHTALPTEDALCSLYLSGLELLEQHNFIQYEVSNFALAGYQCQHNLGYWNDKSYYGYGPSASSYNGVARYQHPASLQRWQSSLEYAIKNKKELPNKFALSTEQRYIESLFLGLRQNHGLYFDTINVYTQIPFEEKYKEKIHSLAKQGYIEATERNIRTTPKGALMLDSILSYFLS